MKTGLWLLSITVPVSFGVLLLQVTGMLDILTRLFAPLFSLFGLPGESALVFASQPGGSQSPALFWLASLCG
jgi:hypothetical protein